MNYNKIIIRYCDKYNIKRYTDFGKSITDNKLRNTKMTIQMKNTKYHTNEKYTILLNSILKKRY